MFAFRLYVREESVTWRCDEMWRGEYIKISKEGLPEQHAVETLSPRQTDPLGATFHAILGWRLDAGDAETESLQHVGLSGSS